jgi:hypothetical protein
MLLRDERIRRYLTRNGRWEADVLREAFSQVWPKLPRILVSSVLGGVVLYILRISDTWPFNSPRDMFTFNIAIASFCIFLGAGIIVDAGFNLTERSRR